MTSTNLTNLQKIGQLEPVPSDPARIARIIASARQQFRDAMSEQISAETRFDCAYNAIRAIADVGLLRQGFRTPTSKPGHHQTAIQSLEHTLGVDVAVVRTLDVLRRQRNSSNYDGEGVTDAALAECLKQAGALVSRLDELLKPT